MRLYSVVKTTSITAKTHENSLSKLWEEAKVGIVAKTLLSFFASSRSDREVKTTSIIRLYLLRYLLYTFSSDKISRMTHFNVIFWAKF